VPDELRLPRLAGIGRQARRSDNTIPASPGEHAGLEVRARTLAIPVDRGNRGGQLLRPKPTFAQVSFHTPRRPLAWSVTIRQIGSSGGSATVRLHWRQRHGLVRTPYGTPCPAWISSPSSLPEPALTLRPQLVAAARAGRIHAAAMLVGFRSDRPPGPSSSCIVVAGAAAVLLLN